VAATDPVAVGRKGPTDQALRMVGAVYRIAYLMGEPPTRAVAQTFQVPRSTAGRWVHLARERGFLGPATARRAG
jgi:transposase